MANFEDIGLEGIEKLKAKAAAAAASRKGGSSLATRRADEATAQRAKDGRVRAASTDKQGNVQLNIRVSPDVKNRVIDLAHATGSDMSSVVETALLEYFKRKEA